MWRWYVNMSIDLNYVLRQIQKNSPNPRALRKGSCRTGFSLSGFAIAYMKSKQAETCLTQSHQTGGEYKQIG